MKKTIRIISVILIAVLAIVAMAIPAIAGETDRSVQQQLAAGYNQAARVGIAARNVFCIVAVVIITVCALLSLAISAYLFILARDAGWPLPMALLVSFGGVLGALICLVFEDSIKGSIKNKQEN